MLGGAIGSELADRLLAHLNIGVTIFFLISGFLLYRPFIAKGAGGPRALRTADYAPAGACCGSTPPTGWC